MVWMCAECNIMHHGARPGRFCPDCGADALGRHGWAGGALRLYKDVAKRIGRVID